MSDKVQLCDANGKIQLCNSNTKIQLCTDTPAVCYLLRECGDAPCTCPTGLGSSYRLAGYTDGDLIACTACDVGFGDTWGGVFDYDSSCTWSRGVFYDINGKALDSAILRLDTVNCKWTIEITCIDSDLTAYVIWSGEKTTGKTPVGAYTRTGGCDTTATLTIEGTLGAGVTEIDEIIVDDDLSAYAVGAVLKYNDICYYLVGVTTCPTTPVTMGTWTDFTSCEYCLAEPIACTDDCSTCSSAYTIVVTGFTGDCSMLNGTHTVYQYEDQCYFVHGEHGGPLEILLYCLDEYWYASMNAYDPDLEIEVSAIFVVYNTTGCPPTTGWVLGLTPDCTGGSITLS